MPDINLSNICQPKSYKKVPGRCSCRVITDVALWPKGLIRNLRRAASRTAADLCIRLASSPQGDWISHLNKTCTQTKGRGKETLSADGGTWARSRLLIKNFWPSFLIRGWDLCNTDTGAWVWAAFVLNRLCRSTAARRKHVGHYPHGYWQHRIIRAFLKTKLAAAYVLPSLEQIKKKPAVCTLSPLNLTDPSA